MGQLPHGRILGLYESGQIDCVVLATLHEGIAVSLIEAMSYGIPVVSTATGGNPELLSGGCGMMVPPRDPDGFAQAVVRVLSEPAFAARLVRSARARVEDDFAVERTVDQLHALFSGSSPRTSGADCNLYTPVAH
jgi:glycosyltransferase involved in cell wall biosynthesis